MEINTKVNYSVLYDGTPMLKAGASEKKKLDDKAKREFVTKLAKSKKSADELLALLKECYALHSNRHIGDAIVSAELTIKSVETFRNSLQ